MRSTTVHTPRPAIDSVIGRLALEAMRAAIADNSGGEVFFVGDVTAEGIVADVEPYAFGNRQAVPALTRMARPGGVAIHNHPSGQIEPSDADISIAAQLGDLGVGFYIVNNECDAVHVVTPPFRERELAPLDAEEVAGLLEPDSPLAAALEGYERRPQQEEMARAASRAFNENGIAVIEAGTGVGKSMAYLLPAALWSARNKERVVVSTNTINLQEQLTRKDIPTLQRALGVEFTTELMKGRNNYLCLRKTQYAKAERQMEAGEDVRAELQSLFDWSENTKDGSLSDLAFTPSDEAWELVMSESDNCLRVKCPFYSRCFFYNARRRAARADILVVNHHLLMADLSLRQETNNYTGAAILPPFQRIVFDEAHNLEAAATAHFGFRVAPIAFIRQLNRISDPRRRKRGLLNLLLRKIEDAGRMAPKQALDRARRAFAIELASRRDETEAAVRSFALEISEGLLHLEGRDLLSRGEEIKRRVTDDFTQSRLWRETLAGEVERVVAVVAELIKSAESGISALEDFPDPAPKELESTVLELRSIGAKIRALAARLQSFLKLGEGHCRWFELRAPRMGAEASLALCVAPLEVGPAMREAVYGAAKTVLMTSATLTVGKRFDYFLGQVGLAGGSDGEIEPELRDRIRTSALTTPFDYARQAYVGAPIDTPEPNQPEFPEALEGLLRRAMEISEGRAFILFTNYRMLEDMHRRLQPEFSARGWLVLKQGGLNRHVLLEQFRAASHPILFATSSFWEGVDVKGPALQCVILTRLPFQVPDDPVHAARMEMIERRGGDPFMEMTVPSAAIRFKQGFGRLIRSKEDRGVALILDARVATRRYGTVFLRSLPTDAIHVGRREEIFGEMERFFGDEG